VTTLLSVVLAWCSYHSAAWEFGYATYLSSGCFVGCCFLMLCTSGTVGDSKVVLAASVLTVGAGIESTWAMVSALTSPFHPYTWTEAEITQTFRAILIWSFIFPTLMSFSAAVLLRGPRRIVSQWRFAVPGCITILAVTMNSIWIPKALLAVLQR